jgi:ribosomal protein L3 glutamine methyltransferase
MAILPEEYQKEPQLALSGGSDGMDLIRRIIYQAKDYINPRGALLLEIGNEYQHFLQAFPDLNVRWLEVSAGNEQVLMILAEDLP